MPLPHNLRYLFQTEDYQAQERDHRNGDRSQEQIELSFTHPSFLVDLLHLIVQRCPYRNTNSKPTQILTISMTLIVKHHQIGESGLEYGE